MQINAISQRFNHIATITAEEERTLCLEYRVNPSKAIADKIVMGNWRYVAKLAHQQSRKYGLSLIDMFQEGCMGMVIALNNFDPEKAFKFSKSRFTSYSKFWVLSRMQKYIIRNHGVVTADTKDMRKRFFWKLEGMEHGLFENSQDRLPKQDVSIDAPAKEESRPMAETLADDSCANPEERYTEARSKQLLSESIHNILNDFDIRDQTILKERFMVDEPKTLQELSIELNITKERVRQLEERAMDKFRRAALTRNLHRIVA